jgi:dynein heavy chain
MIAINCSNLNEHLRNTLFELRSLFCEYFLDQVRSINRELCTTFNGIAERISGTIIQIIIQI